MVALASRSLLRKPLPIYNDKHLSYRKPLASVSLANSFAKAKEMFASLTDGFALWLDDAHRLGFPVLAGSSLPVTWRLPDVELPVDCEIESALMVGVGGSDAMDYHALEAMQCMVECRKGGETGVRAVQLIEGDEVWKAGEDERWSKELLEAALSCSDSSAV